MIYTTLQLAEQEAERLQPYGVSSKKSRGRKYDEPIDPQRLPFQKDRDRIIHCRAFRRLKEKTQVFVAHYGDHYRTRLTHTLEVSQVSRDLARTLGLNEDLAEAIALAHDLGHTPFGHAGESALDACLKPYGLRFEHNEQSRRIVEELEEIYAKFPGLNLSLEVIEGLMKHQSSWDNPSKKDRVRPALEAQLVNLGDEIAYQNHDVDDGLRSGLFTEKDLENVQVWRWACEASLDQDGPIKEDKIRIARRVSKMIGMMIWDIAEETSHRIVENGIKTLPQVYATKESLVGFSKEMAKANEELKEFLAARLYFNPQVQVLSEHGQKVIKTLFDRKMEEMVERDHRGIRPKEAAMEVRDYLAGMTDRFAEQQSASL